MDESRIDAMMKFYNSYLFNYLLLFHLKEYLLSTVTTSLAIVKDNDFAIVEAFKREGYAWA